MVLDISLLITQQYKVRIKDKVEQSKERSSALPYSVVAIEKGDFWSPSITVVDNIILSNYFYVIIMIIIIIIALLRTARILRRVQET